MNLGELIDRLSALDPHTVFPNGFGEPHSWRGAYDELAFQPENNVTVEKMLTHARAANGAEFTGYKGGNYRMRLHTPVHIAAWGFYGGDDDAITCWRWELMCMKAGLSL